MIAALKMTGGEKKLEGLQAARALAALSVAYFHSYIALRAWPELAQYPIAPLKNWGFLGVNFFFAISGYVICVVCSRPGFTVRSFITKRVFRLYPMYFVAMAAIAAIIASGEYRPVSISNFLWSLTLLPQQAGPAYDVSWSMEREIVFYALAAITVPLAGLRGLALVLASLTAGGYLSGNAWSFQVVSTTQADFLAGVVAFLLSGYTTRLGFIIPFVCGVAVLCFSLSRSIPFGPSVAMGMLLVAMTNLQLRWDRAPARWLVIAGDASYSLYLLHYLAFFVMVKVASKLSLPEWACEPWRFITLLLVTLVATQTYRWIERPMIGLGNRLSISRPKRLAMALEPDTAANVREEQAAV